MGTSALAKGSGASPSKTGDWTTEALVDIKVVDDRKASWSTALICVIAVGRRLLNVSSASSACMSSQLTHWFSVAGGSSRTFLHDELLYKILLRLLRVG